MPTNGTHQELIKSKFIEKFRNPLRNYYTYGFMSYSDLPSSSNTIDADWNRLNNILRDDQYFMWSTIRKKTLFMTTDSQSQLCNPFHRVYRFALYNDSDLMYFFNTILALSRDYELAEKAYSIDDESSPVLHKLNQQEYDKQMDSLWRFGENISKRQLTRKQLAVFCESPVPFLTEDQNFRKFLKSIEGLDLLETVSEDKKTVKFKLKKLTLRQIIDHCSDEYDRFVDALDFFSRYCLLGEFGSYLLARLHKQQDSVFRFKHEYYMQSLNDYVLIDLIYAIENSMWCKLTQVNILQKTESKLVCFPLQIRISQTNGRQYLACYDPIKHSYYNIRLDQIDQVEFVKNIRGSSEKIDLSNERIENEIQNAMTALTNSWGVSTTKEQDRNAENPVPLHEVKLVIQYSPEEYYIVNRLKHEKRNGEIKVVGDKIYFNIFVTDTTEMHPWIRSLYTRIIDYSGMDDADFQIVNDLDSFFDSGEEGKISYRPTSFDVRWNITSDVDCDVVHQSEANSLFNKLFGVYFMLFSDVLSALYGKCSDSKCCDCITDDEIKNIISQAYDGRIDELGSLTRDITQSDYSFSIEFALKRNNFAKKGYKDRNGKWLEERPKGMSLEPLCHKKYKAISDCNVDLYFDVIPLTKWELRWLRTILDDPKMTLFLTPDTISSLKEIIPQEITPICIRKNGNNAKATSADNIYYFDRYHSESYQMDSHLFRTILSALHNSEALNINYNAGKGTSFKGIYYPIYIEFSKRDDRFRLYVQEAKTDRIYMMNCDWISAAELTGTNFDMHRCQSVLKGFFDTNQCKVSVEFEDTRNILDRILNEFSPWKKRCECIRKKDEKNEIPAKYKLTIYYHRYDQMDMVVRLMSYGSYIRFIDKEHFICKEIMKRIEKQQVLLRSREKER